MTVIHVDFTPRKYQQSFQEVIEIVHSLVSQGEIILAETVLCKHLKISKEAAKVLIVAIMIDGMDNAIDTGTSDI